VIRKIKSRNNVVEQDHHGVKRITRPMRGFTSFEAAQCTLTGVERMHMLKQKPLTVTEKAKGLTVAEQFDPFASSSPALIGTANPTVPAEQTWRHNPCVCFIG
jgi:putative transposase